MRQAIVGDRYLICSDGLSDYVTRETIDEVLTTERKPGDCAERLVQLALRAGAPDNVTVVIGDVVDLTKGPVPERLAPDRRGRGRDPPAHPPDPRHTRRQGRRPLPGGERRPPTTTSSSPTRARAAAPPRSCGASASPLLAVDPARRRWVCRVVLVAGPVLRRRQRRTGRRLQGRRPDPRARSSCRSAETTSGIDLDDLPDFYRGQLGRGITHADPLRRRRPRPQPRGAGAGLPLRQDAGSVLRDRARRPGRPPRPPPRRRRRRRRSPRGSPASTPPGLTASRAPPSPTISPNA